MPIITDNALRKYYLPPPQRAIPPPKDSLIDHSAVEGLAYYPRRANVGYEEGTNVCGHIRYTNVRDLLASFFIKTHYESGPIPWRDYCIGVWSALWDNSHTHLPMFDYDGRNVKTIIRKDVEMLQRTYGLGPAWVYKTRRGFHVYFLTDNVSARHYMAMLQEVSCCKGFVRAALNHNSAVLRISAKYTDFDIEFEYILRPEKPTAGRKSRKAHLIEALLALGQVSGTHLASLFPDWANFREDVKPWNPQNKSGKRVAKEEGFSIKGTDQIIITSTTYPETQALGSNALSIGGVGYTIASTSTSNPGWELGPPWFYKGKPCLEALHSEPEGENNV